MIQYSDLSSRRVAHDSREFALKHLVDDHLLRTGNLIESRTEIGMTTKPWKMTPHFDWNGLRVYQSPGTTMDLPLFSLHRSLDTPTSCNYCSTAMLLRVYAMATAIPHYIAQLSGVSSRLLGYYSSSIWWLNPGTTMDILHYTGHQRVVRKETQTSCGFC